jgi:hypothetical protein
MTPLDAALWYIERLNFPVFARPGGRYIEHGWHDATTNPDQIRQWWTRYPNALIATPTGAVSGLVVLDIDIKDANGWDSLDDLGHSILDDVPLAHTPSGGLHVHYGLNPNLTIRTTIGKLGPGLDVLSDGHSVTLPTPGSNYRWDDHHHPNNNEFSPAPAWLHVPPPPPPPRPKPVKPVYGLSPYADAAIARACEEIRDAPGGTQHTTLARESFSIGTLAGAGGIPADFARRALIDAGLGMIPANKVRWVQKTVERTVNDCFTAGMSNPRQ